MIRPNFYLVGPVTAVEPWIPRGQTFRQAGVAFAQKLDPDQLLRHIPAPRPRVTPKFKRPGLRKYTETDQGYGDAWHWRFPHATD